MPDLASEALAFLLEGEEVRTAEVLRKCQVQIAETSDWAGEKFLEVHLTTSRRYFEELSDSQNEMRLELERAFESVAGRTCQLFGHYSSQPDLSSWGKLPILPQISLEAEFTDLTEIE